MITSPQLKAFLDEKADYYNHPRFIAYDPIQVPHQFSKTEDIEISAFLTAILSWGQRKTIIANANRLMQLMDFVPHRFIMHASTADKKTLDKFVHRTFNGIDALYFIQSLRNIYTKHGGLKKIFKESYKESGDIKASLIHFRHIFFSADQPGRTAKHISDVTKNASAKRLNMFLRWMVRKDNRGVDFGLWDIPSSSLYLPLDVHTGNTARSLGLLKRKTNDWKAVDEITQKLRTVDPVDPIKYDFALFGLGIFEKF